MEGEPAVGRLQEKGLVRDFDDSMLGELPLHGARLGGGEESTADIHKVEKPTSSLLYAEC